MSEAYKRAKAMMVVGAVVNFEKFFMERYGDEPIRCPYIKAIFDALADWRKET